MEHTQTEIALAHKIHHLQEVIDGLNITIATLQSKLQMERGKQMELMAMIGHQNIHITNLENKNNNTIEI